MVYEKAAGGETAGTPFVCFVCFVVDPIGFRVTTELKNLGRWARVSVQEQAHETHETHEKG